MEKTKNIKLSRKTAVSLIRSVVPLPASAVKKETCSCGVIAYTARTGALDITCSNDWFSGNGRIELTILDRLGGGSIIMYFHPDTLSRDHWTEDAEKAERRRIDRERWAGEVGREQAHKLVDQYLDCRQGAVGSDEPPEECAVRRRQIQEIAAKAMIDQEIWQEV